MVFKCPPMADKFGRVSDRRCVRIGHKNSNGEAKAEMSPIGGQILRVTKSPDKDGQPSVAYWLVPIIVVLYKAVRQWPRVSVGAVMGVRARSQLAKLALLLFSPPLDYLEKID